MRAAANRGVSPARGPLGRLYALTRTGEVAESQDFGTTWSVRGALAASDAVSIRRRGNELFACRRGGDRRGGDVRRRGDVELGRCGQPAPRDGAGRGHADRDRGARGTSAAAVRRASAVSQPQCRWRGGISVTASM